MEIVGWRAFKEGPSGLVGTAFAYGWRPGVNEAQCWYHAMGLTPCRQHGNVCDPCPGEDCPSTRFLGIARGCGFYSLLRGPAEHYDRCLIMGLIVAWGRIIIHEKGMRARYASIVALSDRGGRTVVKPLTEYGAQYRVPVVGYKTLCDRGFASEFGEILD